MATCGDYELGYDDSRFEIVVSQRFHCPICFLVLKDPVMCKNQHYGCSSCIKRHLENSQSCPTCLAYLSVDTLSQAPRIVTDYLSELNIHCEFHPRGCPEIVQVEQLKRHVASCGFAPVPCSNHGCNILVNLGDKFHHETEECDFRRSDCHDCGQLKNEVKEMKDQMLARQIQMKDEMKAELKIEVKGMKEEIKGDIKVMKEEIQVEMKEEMREVRNEVKEEVKGMKEELKGDIKVMKEGIQVEMNKEMREVRNETKEELKNEVKGMKDEIKVEMNKMKEEIKGMLMSAMQNVMVETKIEKPSARVSSSSEKASIIVAGGQYRKSRKTVASMSVEVFQWSTQSWKKLNPMSIARYHASSFVYEGHMMVAGGKMNLGGGDTDTDSIESLNIADQAAMWKYSAVKLPGKCYAHAVVKHKDQLIMSGGFAQPATGELLKRSDGVYEMQLVPPYASKRLTTLPQPRSHHCMELFDDKLFILGGRTNTCTNSVVQYDLIKKECKEMPPLPNAVTEMATVLWRNNVLVFGGIDERYVRQNTVVQYDILTGRSNMLPCMKRKRNGCTAVLTGNAVMVIGGKDENYESLKSVECFDLEHQVWQDLPDMTEARAYPTAVAV